MCFEATWHWVSTVCMRVCMCIRRRGGGNFKLLGLETHQGLDGTKSILSWENWTPTKKVGRGQ